MGLVAIVGGVFLVSNTLRRRIDKSNLFDPQDFEEEDDYKDNVANAFEDDCSSQFNAQTNQR